MQSYCAKSNLFSQILIAESGQEAVTLISKQHFDLLFLDLNMPGLTGKDVLKLIPEDLKVVMVTSDPAFAVESFDYNVIGYLVKPVNLDRFEQTMIRLAPILERQEFIFVKDGTEQVKIALKDVKYIKSESNYVIYALPDKRVMSLQRLSDLEDELPDNFLRIHRSYIVNLGAIDNLSRSSLTLNDGERLSISTSYREAVLARMRLWNA
jgi:DNA-binding LytR/AlgR family response regulator